MTNQLSDTQLLILSAASQRDRFMALPFPETMKARGGAQQKVIASMIAKGLIALAPARADDPIWGDPDDVDRPMTLIATNAGLAAIGIESDTATERDGDAPEPKAARKPRASRKAARSAPTAKDGAKAAKTRTGTKQDALITLLRRPEGASISEIAARFGWQAHTVRGAISGALKKKLKLDVQSQRVDGRGTVYNIR